MDLVGQVVADVLELLGLAGAAQRRGVRADGGDGSSVVGGQVRRLAHAALERQQVLHQRVVALVRAALRAAARHVQILGYTVRTHRG